MRLVAALAITLPLWMSAAAHADLLLDASFSGTVDDGSYTDSAPVNTSYQVGQAIAGSFVYDATTGNFNAFNIGGYTAAPNYTSITSPAFASTGYAYLGVENAVANSGPSDLLQINFYYETLPGPSTVNIANFIANPGAFSQDLTGTPSYFAVNLTNPDGSSTAVDGLLTSYTATVPEPSGLAVMLPALAGLALIRRRFRRNG